MHNPNGSFFRGSAARLLREGFWHWGFLPALLSYSLTEIDPKSDSRMPRSSSLKANVELLAHFLETST
jgi:hypothetical protein